MTRVFFNFLNKQEQEKYFDGIEIYCNFYVFKPLCYMYCILLLLECGLGSTVGIATDYRLDGQGSNPVEARFSARPDWPGVHPASCTMGTGSFPGVKYSQGVLLTTHPLLVPWS